MTAARRTFIRGNRNPNTYGYSLRASCGDEPDPEVIAQAATLLGRESFFVDRRGYECEIIAAAIQPKLGHVAYVESRAKKKWWSSVVDIAIKIHLRDTDGTDRSIDIQSYNPFFGCDVRFFDWYDDVSLLIYREKHDTYACRFGITEWPPRFVEIEDRWLIRESVLAYIGYKQEMVRRLRIPDLVGLEPLDMSEAEGLGLLPPDPYAK
jgi:hypothetical protein